MRRTRTSSALGAIATATALAALALAPAAPASSRYVPPGKGIYAGVSSTGERSDYRSFVGAVRSHVAVLQTFEPWGRWPSEAVKFWKRTDTRGMISISTSPCYGCAEVISPKAIRRGRGDRYLLRLNERLHHWDRPTYIRLMPEMNGNWNPYSAFDADGSSRGRSHRTKQFRKAWRRSVLIVRGGSTRRINRRLRRDGMPAIRTKARLGRRLPRTKAAFLWVPQSEGSPDLRANRPRAYWPGSRYVDWVGADTYGAFPNFGGLSSLYREFRRKPFVIGEWSPWDVDDPGFVRHLHRWVESRGRARMIVYFQGFGENNPFVIQRYTDSKFALRRQLRDRRYRQYAPETREASEGAGGGGGGVHPRR